ncbi:hypothetical protein HanXRQr2_Chr13g0617311 [Helianthus annuus]|uniref:Uncharacterized protein n=1 Tax=Helianthus annuus TaxID=4232 RepID=A0A9K3EM62_HELAN|nr:hypothetical protein HanXRQr2_Chr13g0617011 [Helianthus annuus]KAF5775910.1 hypothetical protein HanXRQr2_Chr13g0617311 [Helianthus annuus]
MVHAKKGLTFSTFEVIWGISNGHKRLDEPHAWTNAIGGFSQISATNFVI